MAINIDKEGAKKFGLVVAAIALAFSTYTSFSYTNFRKAADPLLGVVQFDVNSRANEIQTRYNDAVAKEQAAKQKMAEEIAKRSQPVPTTTTTTLPPSPAKADKPAANK